MASDEEFTAWLKHVKDIYIGLWDGENPFETSHRFHDHILATTDPGRLELLLRAQNWAYSIYDIRAVATWILRMPAVTLEASWLPVINYIARIAEPTVSGWWRRLDVIPSMAQIEIVEQNGTKPGLGYRHPVIEVMCEDLIGWRGVFAASCYLLIVGVRDGTFVAPKPNRFFSIAARLPLELQSYLSIVSYDPKAASLHLARGCKFETTTFDEAVRVVFKD